MLVKSLASPLLTGNYAPRIHITTKLTCKPCSQHEITITTRSTVTSPIINTQSTSSVSLLSWTLNSHPKKWALYSASQAEITTLTEDEKNSWGSCKEALCSFNFSEEEAEKILGKAFGSVHSPYWGEERKRVVPKIESINEILDYLRSLSLSDEDLYKVLKKFPEVLGCDLEAEIRSNVRILESQWKIKGKPLRNLLLRNPKALGYNVDCKGDCISQCTRCWARF